MVIVAVAVLITGAMLLCGGTALALDSPETKTAGVVMGMGGTVLLLLLAALVLFLFLAPIIM